MLMRATDKQSCSFVGFLLYHQCRYFDTLSTAYLQQNPDPINGLRLTTNIDFNVLQQRAHLDQPQAPSNMSRMTERNIFVNVTCTTAL